MPSLLTRRRLLYAIQETTEGTAESVASPPLTVVAAMNPNLRRQVGFEAREGQYGFGSLRGVSTTQVGELTFETELFGSASTTWATVLLPACNVTLQSGSYKPYSLPPTASGATSKTLTFYLYQDGRRIVLRGAMGTFRLRGTAGQKMTLEWRFVGRLDSPTDVALPAYAAPSAIPIRLAASTLTIGAVTPVVKDFAFDLGNVIQLREDASQAAGVINAVVVDRRTTGSLTIESELVATYDPEADMRAHTLRALTAAFSAGSGNSVGISIPDMQVVGVQQADRNGLATDVIEWAAVRDDQTSSGDDEFAIALT